MSEPDDFDALLKQRFDREHQQIPADPFVATTLQRIRTDYRQKEGVRIALRAAAVLAAIVASPWLIDGATRLNAALEAALSWTSGLPGAWVVAALAVAAVLVSRVRSR
jgi:hypothetical protein